MEGLRKVIINLTFGEVKSKMKTKESSKNLIQSCVKNPTESWKVPRRDLFGFFTIHGIFQWLLLWNVQDLELRYFEILPEKDPARYFQDFKELIRNPFHEFRIHLLSYNSLPNESVIQTVFLMILQDRCPWNITWTWTSQFPHFISYGNFCLKTAKLISEIDLIKILQDRGQ